MQRKQLFGPFMQMLTMDHLPHTGPLRDDQLSIIEGGGLLLQGGRVVQVLDEEGFERLKGNIRSIKPFPASQPMVLLPGLIDSHTHMCYSGTRAKDYARRLAGETYLGIAKKGGGIMSSVKSTREASEERLVRLLAERAKKKLLGGVTTCEVKSGYGLDLDSELKILRAIRKVHRMEGAHPALVPTCLAAHMRPPEFSSSQEYLDFVIGKLLPRVKRLRLADRVDIYVEESAFPPDLAEGFLMKAKALGFKLTVHADQFTLGGSQVAARVKAISADHLERSTEKEFGLLRNSGVIAVALPGSSLGLGEPFAPVRKMLDSGLSVAIASDWNPGSAPMGDLLAEAALLGANQKLTIAETLAGITVRAARALDLTDRGTIEAGKVADLVAFKCESFEEILYQQGALRPSLVMHRGRLVM